LLAWLIDSLDDLLDLVAHDYDDDEHDNNSNEQLGITSLDRIQDNINIVNYTKAIDLSSKIIWLEATKKDVSIFTETTTHWRYVPDSGYTIRGEEKIKGLITNTFEVSALFEPVSN
jgi:hypothetical protein